MRPPQGGSNTMKRNRRGLKKNGKNKFHVLGNSVNIIGINAAGITSKMESFNKVLFDVHPSVFMLQETKRKINAPKMNATNLENYQVFELRREKSKEEGGKGLSGGGLAIGALQDLKPVLVRQGDDDTECLTIEICAGSTKIRCVNGYGPQLGDTRERKDKFWSYLEREVIEAEANNTGLVIEIDSNSWAGSSVIPNDPNIQNSNGKLLELFLKRNKGINLVNSLPVCEGLITRKRLTENRNEQSVIDLFLVCNLVVPFVVKMHVDEQGEHQLSNFNGIKHNQKVTESDHAKVELILNIQFPQARPTRNEAYNYKSEECQKYFYNLTTNTRKLSMCFKNTQTFSDQVKEWERNLKSCIIQSFKKIRSRKRKFCETEVGKLLEDRKRIKLELKTDPTDHNETKKKEIERKISEVTEVEYMRKI